MDVYVVHKDEGYEPGRLIGVCSSEELARNMAEKWIAEHERGCEIAWRQYTPDIWYTPTGGGASVDITRFTLDEGAA